MPSPEKPLTAKRITRGRVTPGDWIEAAEQVLVNKSIDAVKVEAVSQHMGVARSSFHHHFKDRDDLLRQLLGSWRDRSIGLISEVFERSDAGEQPLIGELIMLLSNWMSAKNGPSVELAFRVWAYRDEMARRFVDEVDEKRQSYIAHGLRTLGFDTEESRGRAFIVYSFVLADSLLSTHEGISREDWQRLLEELLVKKPLGRLTRSEG